MSENETAAPAADTVATPEQPAEAQTESAAA